MSDLKTQLGDYLDAAVERLDVEDIFVQRVDAPPELPVQMRTPPRRFHGSVYGVAAALTILLVGVLSSLLSNQADVADNQTPTTTIPQDSAPALAVAESFMEAWVAGDGEAVAGLFSAEGGLNGWNSTNGWNNAEEFPALHDWYRAVGQEFQNKGCEPQTAGTVTCTYSVQNELSRILGREPATSSVVFVVADGRIESASGFLIEYLDESGIHGGDFPDDLWGMFREWILVNHFDDYRSMYVGYSSRFDSTSTALWERHTDELTEIPGAVSQLLAEWEAGAEARTAYFADAQTICRAASGRYRAVETELGVVYTLREVDAPKTADILPQIAALNEATARISEEALAELHALPSPPETARGLFGMFYSLAEEQVDVHRQIAAAATAGDTALVETLLAERVDRTHHLDGLLGACPVGLPA